MARARTKTEATPEAAPCAVRAVIGNPAATTKRRAFAGSGASHERSRRVCADRRRSCSTCGGGRQALAPGLLRCTGNAIIPTVYSTDPKCTKVATTAAPGTRTARGCVSPHTPRPKVGPPAANGRFGECTTCPVQASHCIHASSICGTTTPYLTYPAQRRASSRRTLPFVLARRQGLADAAQVGTLWASTLGPWPTHPGQSRGSAQRAFLPTSVKPRPRSSLLLFCLLMPPPARPLTTAFSFR